MSAPDELGRRTPEQARAIKERRAEALARRVDADAEARVASRRGSHLVVRLGRERHAVPLAAIERLAFVPSITTLPGAPPFVLGAVSVGGEALTAIDLGRLIGAAPASDEAAGAARLLVARCGAERVAVRVDGVEDTVEPGRVDEAVRLPGSWLGPEHVRGIGQDGVVVLDLAKVLSDPRLRVDDGDEEEGST